MVVAVLVRFRVQAPQLLEQRTLVAVAVVALMLLMSLVLVGQELVWLKIGVCVWTMAF
jgi:hypothetical protein